MRTRFRKPTAPRIGVDPASVAERLKALEAEKLTVAEQLAAAHETVKVVSVHPSVIKNYLADIERMREALEDEKATERPELIAPLRRLIHSVVVHAEPGVKGLRGGDQGPIAGAYWSAVLATFCGWGTSGSGGPLHRETPYFGSSVFLSKGSITLHAKFHRPPSAVDVARFLYALHRAR